MQNRERGRKDQAKNCAKHLKKNQNQINKTHQIYLSQIQISLSAMDCLVQLLAWEVRQEGCPMVQHQPAVGAEVPSGIANLQCVHPHGCSGVLQHCLVRWMQV